MKRTLAMPGLMLVLMLALLLTATPADADGRYRGTPDGDWLAYAIIGAEVTWQDQQGTSCRTDTKRSGLKISGIKLGHLYTRRVKWTGDGDYTLVGFVHRKKGTPLGANSPCTPSETVIEIPIAITPDNVAAFLERAGLNELGSMSIVGAPWTSPALVKFLRELGCEPEPCRLDAWVVELCGIVKAAQAEANAVDPKPAHHPSIRLAAEMCRVGM